jgi:hypothetical protein
MCGEAGKLHPYVRHGLSETNNVTLRLRVRLCMPTTPCPACARQTPRHLDAASRSSVMSYYICQNCGHIWTVNKLNSSINKVMPLPLKKLPLKLLQTVPK